MPSIDIVILGGGAAGFFAALTAKETHPHATVLLLEKTNVLLSKVRVSGGGRCNVTHSCFDPKQLITHYPRGGRELLGPFTRFQPRDTIQWFESRGVDLKTESDGRMFPLSNSSSSIIACLQNEAEKLKIDIRTKQRVEKLFLQDGSFLLTMASGEAILCNHLLLATGSSPQGYEFAKTLGHTIQKPVPSLFTFNIPTSPLLDLAGISLERATLQLAGTTLEQTGPLLLTHWGFSGPAALKLSAWGARILHENNYKMTLSVDWLPDIKKELVGETLHKLRIATPAQVLSLKAQFNLPKNLWKRLIHLAGVNEDKRLSEISNESIHQLSLGLKSHSFQIDGKTIFKEEFVTCGGVSLGEVNFRTFESRLCPRLYFAGEILDIDAVTGGFNFQNAWTSGWIAGQSIGL
jgi:predicted Rossmann fold flavoprotein